MPQLTRRRAVFGGVLASLALVVVFAALRLAAVPSPSRGLVEEAAAVPNSGPNSGPNPGPNPGVEPTSETAESGTGSGAGAAPAGVSGGFPVAAAAEDTSPAGLLVAAARAGDAHCVRELLAAGAAADSESAGYFAIHGAAGSGSVAALHFLVAAGAHLEALDQFGNTALTQAAFRGNAEAVAFLVGAGADPNAYAAPNNMTPLMAILSGWTLSLTRRFPGIAPKEEERFNAAWALIEAGGDPHFGPGDHPPPVELAKGIGGEIGRLYAGDPAGPDRGPR